MASPSPSPPVYVRLKSLPESDIPDMLHPYINQIGLGETTRPYAQPKGKSTSFYMVSYAIVPEDENQEPFTRTFHIPQSLLDVIPDAEVDATIQEIYNTLSDAEDEDDESASSSANSEPETSLVDTVKEAWDRWINSGKKGPEPKKPD